HRVTAGQQDILRLDVAMNDALVVGVAQRIRDLSREAQCVIQRELLLPGDPVAQRLAFDEGHDVVRVAIHLAGVDQPQDVGMLQGGGGLDFPHKPVSSDDRRELWPENLDRYLPVVLEIFGEIDGRHAALTQLPLNAVAVGEGGRKSLVDGHLVLSFARSSSIQSSSSTRWLGVVVVSLSARSMTNRRS